MIITMILIAALLVFIGWGVHKKKWYFLISGYNTMSKEQQQNVDVEKLAKSIAYMSYIIALLLVLLGVFTHYELWTLLTITTLLIIVVPFIVMIRSNKYYTDGKGGQNKKVVTISLIVTVITLIFVGIVLFTSMRPTTYTIEEKSITISGSYGDTIAFDEIEQLELLDEMPAIRVRTNGSAIGSKLKGNFKLENGERVKLFIDKAIPPFIKLTTKDEIYYFNETDTQKTKDLFEQLNQ